jgi:hypothetical protein
MKITRRQLRKLINETIYVNPEGDAFDTTNDPGSPHMKAFHRQDAKKDFLDAQSDPRLRSFAPDRIDHSIDSRGKSSFDKQQIANMDQGVQLADMVGDQGEFQPFELSKDELELRGFAHDEMRKAWDALEDEGAYNDNTALQKGSPYHGGRTDYTEHIDQIEHQMSLRAKKVLKMFKYPDYWDVIAVLQEVPSYERLMNIIADREGDFSPTMKRLKDLPEKVANQHGVYY